MIIKIFQKASDNIEYHAKIIQDTVKEMKNVKWYQFWKWDFYLIQGPKKIKKRRRQL